MTSHEEARKKQQRIPFISVVVWKNEYQSYVEYLLGPQSLRDYDPTFSSMLLAPGPTYSSPSTNKGFGLKPSWYFLNNNNSNNNNFKNGNDDDEDDDNIKILSSSPIFTTDEKSIRNHRSCSHQAVVFPLHQQNENRGQQILLISDVVVVFVNSDKKPEMLKYLQNRIIPLLIVATSRSGVEPTESPLHCVLVDESDSAAGDEYFPNFCAKMNSQQKKLNVLFSTCGFFDIVDASVVTGGTSGGNNNKGDTGASLSPLENVLEICKTDLKKHLAADAQQQAAQQGKNNNNNNTNSSAKRSHSTTKEAEEIHTFSVLGIVSNKQGKNPANSSNKPSMAPTVKTQGKTEINTASVPASEQQTCSIVVQCHQHSSALYYLRNINNNNNSNNDEQERKHLFVTAARCSQEAICEIVSAKLLFNNNNDNNNEMTSSSSILELTLLPKSPRSMTAAFQNLIRDTAVNTTAVNNTPAKSEVSGIFTTGSIWGECCDNSSDSNNLNSSFASDVVGFNFFSHFPATPQIVIIRVPKMHPRFARGVGGTISLLGFGGEIKNAEILAIAVPSEKRLVEVCGGVGMMDVCVYYACHVPEVSPLYVFERPWTKILLTGSNCLQGDDAHINVLPCEIMFTWRKFEILQKMMTNLAKNSQELQRSLFSSDLPDHEAITKIIVEKIVGEASNGFLVAESSAYSLPIATTSAHDPKSEESIMQFLFAFPSGLPGSSDLVKSLGKAVTRAIVNDFFGDVSNLLTIEKDQKMDDVSNWLFVRKLMRDQENQQRGAICLAHFVLWADNRIREKWAAMTSPTTNDNDNDDEETNSKNELRKQQRMNLASVFSPPVTLSGQDTFAFVKNSETPSSPRHQYGNPGSFLKRFLLRLKFLPYSTTPTMASRTFQTKANLLCPPLTTLATSPQRNHLNELALVGWNTGADHAASTESWALNLMACVTCRWQLEVAFRVVILGNNPAASNPAFETMPTVLARQMLPMMFLANGMDGPVALFLARAYAINMQRGSSKYEGFHINNFIIHFLRNSSLTAFSKTFDALNNNNDNGKICATRQEKKMDTAGTNGVHCLFSGSAESSSLMALLQSPVAALGSAVPRSYQILGVLDSQGAGPAFDPNRPPTFVAPSLLIKDHPIKIFGGSRPAPAAPSQNVASAAVTSNVPYTNHLSKLSEVVVFEMMSDERTKISQLPIHLLLMISKWSQCD